MHTIQNINQNTQNRMHIRQCTESCDFYISANCIFLKSPNSLLFVLKSFNSYAHQNQPGKSRGNYYPKGMLCLFVVQCLHECFEYRNNTIGFCGAKPVIVNVSLGEI
jgi:hypothetical protein